MMLGALALAATLAASPPRWTTRECQRETAGRSSRGIPCGAGEEATYLEFAPSSGAGLPVAEDLCSALAAEVPGWATPGNAFCATSSGGQWASFGGSVNDVWTEVNSPTYTTVPVVPSGPDGASRIDLQLNGTNQRIDSDAVASPAGDVTVCGLVAPMEDPAAQYGVIVGRDGAARVFIVDYTSGAYRVQPFYQGVGAGSAVSGGTAKEGVPSFVCGVYDFVTSGTSTLKLYVDGASVGTPRTDAAGPLVAATMPWYVGFEGSFSTYAAVSVGGALVVEQALSAAQIAAIARRVLADQPKALIQGSPSLDMTYARTGSRFCSKADNTGTILPANRPCIAQNGLLVEAAATNRVPRSNEFNNAAWTKAAGATVTADYGAGPDGTRTAERLVYDATSSYLLIPDSTGAIQTTQSVYLKGTSGSGAVDFCRGGGTGQCVVCNYTSSEWSRCVQTSTFNTSSSGFLGCDVPTKGGACSPAGDVLVAFYQHELGAVATSYIPTTSAAASRGADIAYFTHGQTEYAAGCLGVTWAQDRNVDPSGIIMLADGTTFKQAIIRNTGFRAWIGGASAVISSVNPTSVATHSTIARWGGAATSIVVNGTTTSAAGGTAQSTTRLYLGSYDTTSGTTQSGRYSSVQFDPRPSRCR